jgi:hypothetical protein
MKYKLRYEFSSEANRSDATNLINEFENDVNDFLKNKNYGKDIEAFMHVFRVFIDYLFRIDIENFFHKKNW